MKKGIVNSLTVFERDNAQDPIFHFGDARPAANSPIGLYLFTQWISDNVFNPFIQNHGTVWTLAGVSKVWRALHPIASIIALS
jgi:hypothetical protein